MAATKRAPKFDMSQLEAEDVEKLFKMAHSVDLAESIAIHAKEEAKEKEVIFKACLGRYREFIREVSRGLPLFPNRSSNARVDGDSVTFDTASVTESWRNTPVADLILPDGVLEEFSSIGIASIGVLSDMIDNEFAFTCLDIGDEGERKLRKAVDTFIENAEAGAA